MSKEDKKKLAKELLSKQVANFRDLPKEVADQM